MYWLSLQKKTIELRANLGAWHSHRALSFTRALRTWLLTLLMMESNSTRFSWDQRYQTRLRTRPNSCIKMFSVMLTDILRQSIRRSDADIKGGLSILNVTKVKEIVSRGIPLADDCDLNASNEQVMQLLEIFSLQPHIVSVFDVSKSPTQHTPGSEHDRKWLHTSCCWKFHIFWQHCLIQPI